MSGGIHQGDRAQERKPIITGNMAFGTFFFRGITITLLTAVNGKIRLAETDGDPPFQFFRMGIGPFPRQAFRQCRFTMVNMAD